MAKRILNANALASHGNVPGRKAILEILEAGLQAADPYNNTAKLVHIDGDRLIVGCEDFVPASSPKTGDEVYQLSDIDRIYVFGAGKGSQRAAKAIEDLLGGRLTGGHIIAKHGDEKILERIGVTFGAHPVPDVGCVEGCKSILEMSRDLTERDLVFTIAANGISSLLTLPVPGVSLEDVRRTTYLMQIERGASTLNLNPVRNHLDMMKGGRLSAHLQPARAVHICVYHLRDYHSLMYDNHWLHNLPIAESFDDAVAMLKRWDAWDAIPAAVRAHLERADPRHRTVTAEQFERMAPSRIFCIMPDHLGMLPSAQKKAAQLGFRHLVLADWVQAEASQAGLVVGAIASSVERLGQPIEPPCALLSGGELLVTVGQESGIGGRNQEFALSAARRIAGSANVVIGAVDSDGTDGPSTQFAQDGVVCPALAGGIVDGQTVARAEGLGIDIHAELRRHNATPALCKLEDGIIATRNISMNDLDVALILGRDPNAPMVII